MANLIYIDSAEKLDALFAKSHEHPVALVKHSNSCGISAHTLFLLGEIDADLNVIVIQEHRDLSNDVAVRLGYTHQSPQAFVIDKGKVVYHATHYGIEPEKIEQLLTNQ